jgi:low affinity Fe/Cu permease
MSDSPESTAGHVENAFATAANRAAAATGSFWAFAIAVLVVLVWVVTGPVFGYSDTWQLVINTGTTIVTFLMVFLIQHAQNKETRALQLKLNELIAAVRGASNRLIDIEDLSDEELDHLYKRYRHLAKTAEALKPGAHTSIDDEHDGDDAGKPAGGPGGAAAKKKQGKEKG